MGTNVIPACSGCGDGVNNREAKGGRATLAWKLSNDLRISCRDRLETASDAGAGRPGPGSFIRGLARRPEPTPAARRCIPRPPRPHGREPVVARRNGARRHLAEPGAPGPTRRQRRPSMCRAPRRPVVLAPRNSLVSSAHWPDSASVRSTPTIISWAPRTAALANGPA